MFSVRNRSNIRQVTPYGEYGPFESKTFYPVSKVYANAKAFFKPKPQFEVFEESLPAEVAKPVDPIKPPVPKVQEQNPAPKLEETTEEKPKQEVVQEETPKPAEAPVVPSKPKGRRSL